ncbi:MAG: signal peptidase I [Eubacterium sp.]|nr:signal peptidase I [Eubacterium sp.]
MERERERKLIRHHILSAICRAVVSAAALTLVYTFVFGIATVERNDMFPQIHAGDSVVYFRPGSIGMQDAVIYDSLDGTAAGRIAACPGDTVDVTDSGLVTINGNIQPVQKRLGIFEETSESAEGISYPVVLGDDEFFILGDSRGDAKDSRIYGCIRREDIRGVVFLLIRRRTV